MKHIIIWLISLGFSSILSGCAIYASPYGYSAGYYGYAPYYGFDLGYWPHSYYSIRPHRFYGSGPGFHGWGGGQRWGGNYYGGGHRGEQHWGGHGGGHRH